MLSMCFEVNLTLINITMEHWSHSFRKYLWINSLCGGELCIPPVFTQGPRERREPLSFHHMPHVYRHDLI